MTKFATSVVQKSDKNANTADQFEKQIIVSNLQEKPTSKEDFIQIKDICETVGLNSNCISEVKRLGSPTTGYHRLLKVTFTTKFDARIFWTNYEHNKRTNESLKNYKIRPMLPIEVNKARRENSNLVFKWNKESLSKGVSYSLRFDGSIWCFKKQTDGRWLRDMLWKMVDYRN